MTLYCEVKDNEIIRYNIERPKAYQNISFGSNATDNDFKSVGLYPIVDNQPTYDSATQRIDGVSYSFDGNQVIKNYTVSGIDIETVKQDKLKDIQERKNVMRDVGFYVNDVKFDSDMAARTAYLELAMQIQMNPAFTIKWKASNGVWVDMDATLFQAVMAAGKTHIEYCFVWQETKEQEVKAATTVDEVNAVELT